MEQQQSLILPPTSGETLKLMLPWPPSANHYQGYRVMLPSMADMQAAFTGDWRALWQFIRKKAHVQSYPTVEAKEYGIRVHSIVQRAGARKEWAVPCSITMRAFPPDRRRRDTSNLWKVVEDSLVRAKVVQDDSQFIEHHAFMMPTIIERGRIEVEIGVLV